MGQDGQHLFAAFVTAVVLAGAHGAFNHGVGDFQVRGVVGQREVHRAVRGGHVGAEAHVVFHVAAGEFGVHFAFEFVENGLRGFAHGVYQHVQAAAVRHADYDFLHAFFGGGADQVVQRGHGAFAAFEREALLTHIAGVQIALHGFGGGDFFEDAAFGFGVKLRAGAVGFQTFLQPFALGGVGNVHVFQRQGAAVDLFQMADDFGQGQLGAT